jgi:integrase
MTVHKRGGRWHYAFMINGTRYRGALPEARTKKEAEEGEAQVRHSISQGTYGKAREEVGTTLFAEFVDEVYLPWARDNKKSWRNDVDRGRVLAEYFKGMAFRDITPMVIEKFKRDRLKTKTRRGGNRHPNTVNKELQLLSRVFSMAVDNELAESNPCRRVRQLKCEWQRDRYLLPEEERQLMARLTGRYAHLKPIVVIALNTGMRRGEILGLRWDEVDFVRNVLRVRRTKSGKERFLPMNSLIRDMLLERRALDAGAVYVFGGPTGQPMTDIKNGFRTICQKAEIANFRFHDLRHTAATRMAEAGVDIRTIAEFLGHATIQMTMRYAHATDDAKRREAAALETYAVRHSKPLEIAPPATESSAPQKVARPKRSEKKPGRSR